MHKNINTRLYKLSIVAFVVATVLFSSGYGLNNQSHGTKNNSINGLKKSEKEWKACLSSEEYQILREKGTEMAFTGKYYKHQEQGVYKCSGCGTELFSSETKYDSGSGWPSFWKPIANEKISSKTDMSLSMSRTEILCSSCGGHLGHVFNDGPKPTGMRYCVNSVSLEFEAQNPKFSKQGDQKEIE